jgi:hypothetical protein
MMPTCFAPSSVQQKIQFFFLWKSFHKRRAWLFADTPKGAHASAIYYSLVESAKASGLDPYAYLRQVLAQLPYADSVEKYEVLLPWNIKLTGG